MSRTEELLSIGLIRISDISKKIIKDEDTIRYRIKKLGIIPFEKYWYDEYQIDLIRFFNNSKEKSFSKKRIEPPQNLSKKPVLNIYTGIFYDSAIEACECYNLVYFNILKHLNGTRKVNKTDLIYI